MNIRVILSLYFDHYRKWNMLSKYKFINGLLDESEQALLQEKALVDSLSPTNYALSKNLYQTLAYLKEKQGDSQAALPYYKDYIYYFSHIISPNNLIRRKTELFKDWKLNMKMKRR